VKQILCLITSLGFSEVESENMNAIVPAAGSATRMRGLPKFLLPCSNTFETLIENHVKNLLLISEVIWIPTRPEFEFLITALGFPEDRVRTVPMVTENMTQTIQAILEIDPSEYFELIMPDTYFQGDLPYSAMTSRPNIAHLACWSIQAQQKGKLGQVDLVDSEVKSIEDKNPNCLYDLSWGALTFSRKLMHFASLADPHIGYAVKKAIQSGERITGTKIQGKYYDCGTPDEFLLMIKENLIDH
jgi:hypothetical protein